VSYFKKWIEKISNSTLLNDGLNLSELFHPEIFINACKQRFSRKLKIPIDELKTISTLDDHLINDIEVIKLKGLLMQGAIVNRNYMIQEEPKNQPEFNELPTLYISFVHHSKHFEVVRVAEFPIFTSEEREKMLFSVNLPYEGQIDDKILSGTAILLPEI
jgi:dynein heavy chain 2